MRVVLKITSGPYSGHSVLLRSGQTIRIGRTEWADFTVPHDNRLSGVHFSLECDNQMCRLRDLESTNGTLVNGQKTSETEIKNGDVIEAGRTSFVVEVEAGDITQSVSNSGLQTTSLPIPPPEPSQAPILVTVAEPSFLAPVLATAAAGGRPYDKALADEDPLVRREALLAAVWTRQPWLLDYCRAVASQPALEHWDELWLLAVLGQPSDLDRVLTIGRTTKLGIRRFGIYASYGHPRTIRDLLFNMGNKVPDVAVAAGLAFTKITGINVASDKRATLPPEDGSQPDEFEQEFLPEATLPDPEKAAQQWQAEKDRFAAGVRWRGGKDISQGINDELMALLDMEGRYEACLRGKYEGTWHGTRQQLEKFPL